MLYPHIDSFLNGPVSVIIGEGKKSEENTHELRLVRDSGYLGEPPTGGASGGPLGVSFPPPALSSWHHRHRHFQRGLEVHVASIYKNHVGNFDD